MPSDSSHCRRFHSDYFQLRFRAIRISTGTACLAIRSLDTSAIVSRVAITLVLEPINYYLPVIALSIATSPIETAIYLLKLLRLLDAK